MVHRRSRLLVAVAAAALSGSFLAATTSSADAATYLLSTSTFVEIGDGTTTSSGTHPYPLSVTANGMGGAITDVDVELPDLYHARPYEFDVVIVGPSGTAVYLKAGTWCERDLDYERPHVSWRFSDQAADSLDGGDCPSGWYRPTVADHVAARSLPAPAPPAPYATKLSAFNGQNPNGTWRLYVNDPVQGAQGALGQGFRVIISTAATGAIIGNTNGHGPASSYPLERFIGATGRIADARVTLTGLSHTNPDDLDIVLQSPSGRTVVLMSDACGGSDLTSASLTFSDAGSLLPDEGSCGSGTFQPADGPVVGESLPAPAPPGPYAGSLSALDGTRADGTWRVYINDDLYGDSGYVNSFAVQLAILPETTITRHPPTRTTSRGARFVFAAQLAGSTFECRLDRDPWSACVSPKVYTGLALGEHTFRVRATSSTGYLERSPARWEWRVTRTAETPKSERTSPGLLRATGS